MSNRVFQDGATTSYTGENLQVIEDQAEEVQIKPRVTRNATRGRRGRAGGRTGGRVGRPRNPTTTNIPADNLSDEISRVIRNTLPSIVRQVANKRREERA